MMIFDKRRKFVLFSMVLAGLVLASLWWAWPLWMAVGIGLVAYGGFIASMWPDLDRGWSWFLSPLLVVLAAVAAFLWLRLYMDDSWLILLGSVGFGIGMYGLLLTVNIMHLSRLRSVPLARTAASVLSLGVFMLSFLYFYIILHGMPSYLQWVLSVAGVSLVIAWSALWLSQKKGRIAWRRSLVWASLVGLLMGQMAMAVGVWPRSFMVGVFLSSCLYLSLGIIHYQQQRQVNRAAQRQYLSVFGMILIGLYVVTTWYGG